jgi:acyl-CoA reductase-like NAD-dependent aldehyde dehydrogenase
METVADQFEQLLVAKFQALRVGDPLDETVDIWSFCHGIDRLGNCRPSGKNRRYGW